MSIQLIVNNSNLSKDELQVLTGDLCQTLMKETTIQAVAEQGKSQLGGKGEPITLGVLILSFITSGSAVALIEVLKSYIMRDSSLEIEVKRGEESIKINLQNVQTKQVEQVLASVKQILEKEEHD